MDKRGKPASIQAGKEIPAALHLSIPLSLMFALQASAGNSGLTLAEGVRRRLWASFTVKQRRAIRTSGQKYRENIMRGYDD